MSPKTTYDAKKVICPLGLEVERIHACKNDCILFHGEHADLKECPKCKTSRYKCRKDGGNEERTKGAPRTVVWYFPLIPHLKHIFANNKEAQLIRWHEEGCKKDQYLRHPTDSMKYEIWKV